MSDCPHNENNTEYCNICLRTEIVRLTEMINNAINAACDTQPSWEWRCYVMANELGANFDKPTTRYGRESDEIEILMDTTLRYAKAMTNQAKRIEDLEAAIDGLECDHELCGSSSSTMCQVCAAKAKLEEKP
jgi:hypothetical protein